MLKKMDRLPKRAQKTTSQPLARSHTFPITSSQGLNASGCGQQRTSRKSRVNSPQKA